MQPLTGSNVGRGNGVGDKGLQAEETACAKAQSSDGTHGFKAVGGIGCGCGGGETELGSGIGR